MKRMEVRRSVLPDTAAEMMAHFGSDPFSFTPAEERILWRAQFLPRFFVLDKEDRAAGRGWCSVCRRFGTLKPKQKTHHKDKATCPHCGEALEVEHVWRMSKYISDWSLLYQWRRSKIEPGALVCRAVEVSREWCKSGERPDLLAGQVDVVSFYVYRPGSYGWQLKLIYRNGRWNAKRPAPLDREYEPITRIRHSWRIAEDRGSLMRAVKGSPLRHGMEVYGRYQRDHFLRFFDWSGRYSSVEKLVKMGLGKMVASHMERGLDCNSGAIYWGGATLEKIFRGRLTKADKRFLLEDGDCIRQADLVMWQFFRGKLSIKEVVERKEWLPLAAYITDFKRIARHVDGMRAMAYLKRQGEKQASMADQWPWNVRTYGDYLRDAAKLSMDFSDKSVLYPKDLYRAHQNTIRQVKYQENQALEERYAKGRRAKMEKAYQFAAMGMRILVPERLSDLIAEGKAQHTCVGGYMERVAKGETDVVFVRREVALDAPYITMEIHRGMIYQARGKNNRAPDEAGRAFIEAFKAAKLKKKEEEKERVTA